MAGNKLLAETYTQVLGCRVQEIIKDGCWLGCTRNSQVKVCWLIAGVNIESYRCGVQVAGLKTHLIK